MLFVIQAVWEVYMNKKQKTKQKKKKHWLHKSAQSKSVALSFISVCGWCNKGSQALTVAAGLFSSATELQPIPSPLTPAVINNPARGCRECHCASTTWTPALHSPASSRKGCAFVQMYMKRADPGIKMETFVSPVGVFDFCCEPYWATAVLYLCDMEDSVCNYYLSDKDLKPH